MRVPPLVCACLLVASTAAATSRSGVLMPEIPERFDAARGVVIPVGATRYVLHKGRRRVPVAPDARYVPGATLKIRGTLTTDGLLQPEADDRGVKVLKLPPQTPAFPVEHLLVLLMAHPGTPPNRPRAAITADFQHLADRVAESSYGQTTMTVQVEDWQTTPLLTACDFSGALNDAMTAHQATVDFRAFTLLVVVEADGAVCADGSGGPGGGVGRVTIATPDGSAYLGTAITGASWAASLHEVGHAMNLAHANSLDCAVPGVPMPDLPGCVNREYGDPFDLMGQALGDLHVLHKRQLGWVRAVGPEALTTVTEPGTYVLEPLEVPSLGRGPKGLVLPLATVPLTWLALEARQPSGLDWLYPDDWFDGVLLHASVSGVVLPNVRDELERQGPLSSHFVWSTTEQQGVAGRVPTGGRLTVWPWRVRVLSRDATKVVTVAIDDARTLPPPSPTPTRTSQPSMSTPIP